ncbi:F-box/WD repeat-containing protein [Lachnellula suecica]|uniref:F-box/WD repeat-containing protein n=1 Tax=Lachnellula suecica TaxID=602035 RepID=A0A8T9C8D5_9HELO|nr:F-box/WD repeat-containing protein [Lachnellula suecica]
MTESKLDLAGTCVFSESVPKKITANALPTALEAPENYIIVSLDNGEIHTFDIHGTERKSLDGCRDAVWALAVWNNLLASGGVENEVKVWDLKTGQNLQALQGHTSTVRALRFLSDGKRLISASRDTSLRYWDLVSGKCLSVSTAHTGTIRSIALSASEDLLVSGSYDGTACLWRVSDTELVCLHTLRAKAGPIYCVAFNDSAKQVVTAGSEAQVRVWNQENGQLLAALEGNGSIVNQIRLRGSTLVTSDASGYISIWSLSETPELISRLHAHSSSVACLDFDGSRIVSADAEGSVILTNGETGTLLGNLSQNSEAVWKVAFGSEHTVVAILRREGKVLLEVRNLEI